MPATVPSRSHWPRRPPKFARKSVKEFASPDFVRLATDLEARAGELAEVAPDQWAAECRRRADDYAPVTTEALEDARASLKTDLDALERRLPAVRQKDSEWAKFLFWPETLELLTAKTQDGATLDRLETRWRGMLSVWEVPESVEASLAMQSTIRLIRAYQAAETKEAHAAAWNALAALAEHSPPADIAALAAAVKGRERLGQSAPVTVSIRRSIMRPTVVLRAKSKWLEDELTEKMDETFKVNDVFAGARSIGNGRLTGTMEFKLLPSSAVGQWLYLVDGMSRSSAVGSSEGVQVSSRTTTRMRGEKRFALDDRGIRGFPAKVSATSAIVYDSINAGGRRRRQSEAINQTYARRGQAEMEAAAATRRAVGGQMDDEGRDMAKKFNDSYYKTFRDSQLEEGATAPEVRVRATPEGLRYEYRVENAATFDVPPPLAEFEPDADLVISFAAKALENESLATLGGRRLNADELAKAIAELMGGDEVEETGQEFHAAFAAHPCDITFADGQLHARLHVTNFDSADVQYPAMTVDIDYNVENREGSLALVRQGSVRVKPVSQTGEPATVSGRQQTLRLAVQRKLNKALAEEFLWPGLQWPSADDKDARLSVGRVQASGGWLQMSLHKQKHD